MICMYVWMLWKEEKRKGSGWIGWDYNGVRERGRERLWGTQMCDVLGLVCRCVDGLTWTKEREKKKKNIVDSRQ